MKKLKQITALAKRITIRGPITRVKVRRILPKGKAFWHHKRIADATPQEFMNLLIKKDVKEKGFKRFEFSLGGGIKCGYYVLIYGTLAKRVTFPSGSASRREVKRMLTKHATKLMQKYPEIKELRIR